MLAVHFGIGSMPERLPEAASSSAAPASAPLAQDGSTSQLEPGSAPAGGSSEDAAAEHTSQQPVTLTIAIAPPSVMGDENARLRTEIHRLEQRVTREAQTWAEQRAQLVKEREELRAQVEEKDAAIWRLMNGEVTLTGPPGQLAAKRKAAASGGGKGPAPKKGGAADKAGSSTSPDKAKAAAAGKSGASAAGGKAAGGGKSKAAGKANAGSPPKAKAPSPPKAPSLPKPSAASPPEPDPAAAIAAEAKAAKQAEVAAAAAAASAAAEAKHAEAVAKAQAAAAAAAAANASGVGLTDNATPSAMVAMVSAASAMVGALLGGGGPSQQGEGSSAAAEDEEGVDDGVLAIEWPRRLGFRPRPDFVPALLDFRRAMVRSPRGNKKKLLAAPAAKPPAQAQAQAKQVRSAPHAMRFMPCTPCHALHAMHFMPCTPVSRTAHAAMAMPA